MSVARTTKALLTVAAATTMALATGPAQAAACLVSDVTLKIGSTVYAPSACGDGVDQGGGPIAETNSLNAVLDTASFVYLDSSEDAGTPAGINGIAFVVSAASGNSGNWSIKWIDVAGSPNLPLLIDFGVALFGGNAGAGYRFKDVLLTVSPDTGNGTFDVNFLNHGGQQPTLSHLLLSGGEVPSCASNCDPQQVPEPGTAALAGVALLGAALVRRRRPASLVQR